MPFLKWLDGIQVPKEKICQRELRVGFTSLERGPSSQTKSISIAGLESGAAAFLESRNIPTQVHS